MKIYSACANFVLKCTSRRDQIKVLVVHVAAENVVACDDNTTGQLCLLQGVATL